MMSKGPWSSRRSFQTRSRVESCRIDLLYAIQGDDSVKAFAAQPLHRAAQLIELAGAPPAVRTFGRVASSLRRLDRFRRGRSRRRQRYRTWCRLAKFNQHAPGLGLDARRVNQRSGDPQQVACPRCNRRMSKASLRGRLVVRVVAYEPAAEIRRQDLGRQEVLRREG